MIAASREEAGEELGEQLKSKLQEEQKGAWSSCWSVKLLVPSEVAAWGCRSGWSLAGGQQSKCSAGQSEDRNKLNLLTCRMSHEPYHNNFLKRPHILNIEIVITRTSNTPLKVEVEIETIQKRCCNGVKEKQELNSNADQTRRRNTWTYIHWWGRTNETQVRTIRQLHRWEIKGSKVKDDMWGKPAPNNTVKNSYIQE